MMLRIRTLNLLQIVHLHILRWEVMGMGCLMLHMRNYLDTPAVHVCHHPPQVMLVQYIPWLL